MKTHILTLAAIAALTTIGLADSPDAILKDYRKQATQATQRLNETLEKQSSPIITDLLRKNDTAGAEAVATQVKAKLSGEPIVSPHVSAAALFAQYDGARATALQPIQKATLKRLDSLLNVPGGPKTEDLASLTKAKAEVEAGKTSQLIPTRWSYHASLDAPPIAEMSLSPNGTFTLSIVSKGTKEIGAWKVSEKPSTISLTYGGQTWDMTVDGRKASMNRPDSGMRYLKAIGTSNL